MANRVSITPPQDGDVLYNIDEKLYPDYKA